MTEDWIFADSAEPFFGQQQGMSLLRVHGPEKCAGDRCCIHNPTDHHMRTWRQNWRADKAMMERFCPHGIGHPDPDDLMVRTTSWAGVHGCDGCCRPPDRNLPEQLPHVQPEAALPLNDRSEVAQ